MGNTPTLISTTFGAKQILMHPSYPNYTSHIWVITGDGQKIYKTTSSGTYWTEIITTGLPKPLNDLQHDPSSNALIYVGTSAGIYKIDPAPEAPTVFRVAGTECTPTTCNTLASVTPLAPAPCYPIISWNSNLEVDLATSGRYELERKIGSGGAWNNLTSTNNTSYTDGQVELSSTGTILVHYRVKAKDVANNYSGYSSEICVFAKSAPLAKAVYAYDEFEKQEIHEFRLNQNSPNPFNPFTSIKYQLAEDEHVMLKVYDVVGREVFTLVDEIQNAGYKSVTFNAGHFPSGVYFYRLSAVSLSGQAGKFSAIKKMLLVRFCHISIFVA